MRCSFGNDYDTAKNMILHTSNYACNESKRHTIEYNNIIFLLYQKFVRKNEKKPVDETKTGSFTIILITIVT